eukprot:c1033_g1_i1.p1 GENE.c1033_g1_i1~~c1033_g1_i1.p1  ORF type:complete len:199 (-),score=43.44 c1033_g1_i1:47-643(-)
MVVVCVFGSSAQTTPEKYLEASRELAKLLAEGGHICVNGGGRFGCMGALNETGVKLNAQVIGCIHRMWVVDGADHPLQNLRIADGPNLHHRKQLLYEDAECFICLPGGMGTFDELWEVACEHQLGLRQQPICLLNVDGFYDGFVIQLKRAYADGLLKYDPFTVVHVEDTPSKALAYCVDAISRHVTIPTVAQRSETPV